MIKDFDTNADRCKECVELSKSAPLICDAIGCCKYSKEYQRGLRAEVNYFYEDFCDNPRLNTQINSIKPWR